MGTKPKDLGLAICVSHPGSEVHGRGRTPTYEPHELDADGRHIQFEMRPMPGQHLAEIVLRRGIDPRCAAALLRQVADTLDRHGGRLLSMPRGGEGFIDRDGELVADPLQVDYDDDGKEIVPPVV